MTDEEFMQLMQAGQQQLQQIPAGADAPQPGRSVAEQKYLQEVGPGTAVLTGAGEAVSFGQIDKLIALIDELTGAAEQVGYVPPERRTELAKEKYPAATAAGDIGTSLLMGAIPVGGQAMLAARGVRGAQALGKAMPAVQAGLGMAETAGRGGDIPEIITSGFLAGAAGGLPAAGRAIGGGPAARMVGKAQPGLVEEAEQARKSLRSVRSAYEPMQEMKALRQAQAGARQAQETEKKVAQSIFDEPVQKMTAERATQLQEQISKAKAATGKAQQVEKEATKAAGPMLEAVSQAQQKAMAAEQVLVKNREKIEKLTQQGGKIGEIARMVLSGPVVASAVDQLTEDEAEKIALIEAVEKNEKPSVKEVIDAAKTLMKLAD